MHLGEPKDIIFRNYTPLDSLAATFKKESMEQLKQVTQLEQMYQRKVKRQIREYVKSEDDPIKGLIPKKSNIDLKRSLGLKLEKLNRKTERSILELLSKVNKL